MYTLSQVSSKKYVDVHRKAKAKSMDRIIGATPRTRPLPPLSSGKLTLHSLVLQHVTLQASAPDPNSSLQDLGSSPHR